MDLINRIMEEKKWKMPEPQSPPSMCDDCGGYTYKAPKANWHKCECNKKTKKE